jgi:hypothetical protein
VQPLGWFKCAYSVPFTRENVDKVVADVAGMTTREAQEYRRATSARCMRMHL